MTHFLSNFLLLAALFAGLVFVGLGPTAILSNRKSFILNSLLAPSIGMVIITSFGLFRLGILRVPLKPGWILGFLFLFSLFSLVWSRHLFKGVKSVRPRSIAGFFIIPVLYVIMMAGVFSPSGFHLLSGGEDEFLYSSIADHMLKYQYQGGPLDTLQARPDHWLYDSSTRQLGYALWHRHSAEIFLATVSWAAGRSTSESFPITVILAMLSFLTALVAISKICFRYRGWQILLLQFGFAFSFYPLLLHIQGSLANLCSMGMFLSGTALGFHSLLRVPGKRTSLAAVLIAGTIIFYSEVSLPGALVPLGVASVWFFISKPSQRRKIVTNSLWIALVAAALSHQAIYTMIQMVFMHLQRVGGAVHSASALRLTDLANALGPEIGVYTYYSLSPRNQKTAQFASTHPKLILAFLIGLLFFACVGIFRGSSRASSKQSEPQKALLIAPIIFSVVALTSIYLGDALRFFRSIGYIYSYLLIGLVGVSRTCMGVLAFPLAAAFCLMNFFSTGSTLRHVFHYNVETEPIIRRFNPNDMVWIRLREELNRESEGIPVLIADFDDTVRPHWITVGIEPVASWPGEKIRKFWRLMEPKETNPYFAQGRKYAVPWDQVHELSEVNFPDWQKILPEYVEKSRLAIVPLGGIYPSDWRHWDDIFSPRRTRYSNICDVVYKFEKSVEILPEKSLGKLQSDEKGLYRELVGSFEIKNLNGGNKLTLEFEGSENTLHIQIAKLPGAVPAEVSPEVQIERHGSLRQVTYLWKSDEAPDKVEVEGQAGRSVKVRKISWEFSRN